MQRTARGRRTGEVRVVGWCELQAGDGRRREAASGPPGEVMVAEMHVSGHAARSKQQVLAFGEVRVFFMCCINIKLSPRVLVSVARALLQTNILFCGLSVVMYRAPTVIFHWTDNTQEVLSRNTQMNSPTDSLLSKQAGRGSVNLAVAKLDTA